MITVFAPDYLSPDSHMIPLLAQSLKLVSSMSCFYLFQAEEDPLFWHGGFRTRHSFVLLESCDYAVNNLPNITIPVLVLQGSADKLVTFSINITTFLQSKSPVFANFWWPEWLVVLLQKYIFGCWDVVQLGGSISGLFLVLHIHIPMPYLLNKTIMVFA